LIKSEKDCAFWLNACHHGWQDRMIPYSMMKRLIAMAVIGVEENDDNKTLVHVKRLKNANSWLICSIATT